MNWYCRPTGPNDWSPNITASAIIVSATGKPVRIRAMRAGNIQSEDIKRTFLAVGAAWRGKR
jgi:hypothetical protein